MLRKFCWESWEKCFQNLNFVVKNILLGKLGKMFSKFEFFCVEKILLGKLGKMFSKLEGVF